MRRLISVLGSLALTALLVVYSAVSAVGQQDPPWAPCKGNDNDEVIVNCTHVLRKFQLYPRNLFAYSRRGRAYFNKGDYDRAIRDFDEVIRLDPKFALAYTERGTAYGSKGESYA